MAEYQGKKVSLNKPFRTPKEKKKFAVYVKNDKGNVIKVRFGDPKMSIKSDQQIERKATVLAVGGSRENRIELQQTTGVGRCGIVENNYVKTEVARATT